jgi:hypothetical protein
MLFIRFMDADGSVNEAAFNDLQARIMALKNLPDGETSDWAQPLAHQTDPWIAMPVDESCYPVMTDAEIAAQVPYEQLRATGWIPPSPAEYKAPWWGFLVWWR